MPTTRNVDAVEDARLTIKHVAKSKIKSTEKSLNHRLAEIAQRVKTTREKDLEARENLLAPLSEDLLELSGEGGLPPIVVSLDERIRLYGKFVADKKKAITGLWTQWDETQKELEALAIEVFGPRALGIIAAVSEGTTNDIVTNAKQEFMETIEAEKSKLKEEIDQMSSRFREEMVAGEKVTIDVLRLRFELIHVLPCRLSTR